MQLMGNIFGVISHDKEVFQYNSTSYCASSDIAGSEGYPACYFDILDRKEM